ncbi:Kinase, NEK [Giardia muris]|uniref:Kinase, NEK n=1 Tax=Giardia muris TaxID=5742 RepID=A0A4Z1SRS2_GIAMU|nr:Kinase, NEK [Giardia muris]|eukprot:TNJ28602.1 Kinase, NEK [Giardia muris]
MHRIISIRENGFARDTFYTVGQRGQGRLLCHYELKMEGSQKSLCHQHQARLDHLLSVHHTHLRPLYPPSAIPNLYYGYCGGGSLQEMMRTKILLKSTFLRVEVLSIAYQLCSAASFLHGFGSGVLLLGTPLIIDPRCVFFTDRGVLQLEFGFSAFEEQTIVEETRVTAPVDILRVQNSSHPLSAGDSIFYDVIGETPDILGAWRGTVFGDGSLETSEEVSQQNDENLLSSSLRTSTSSRIQRSIHVKSVGKKHCYKKDDICHYERYLAPEMRVDGPCTEEGTVWSIGRLLFDICQLALGSESIHLIAPDHDFFFKGLDQMYGESLATFIRSLMSHIPSQRPTFSSILEHPMIQEGRRIFEREIGIVRGTNDETQLMQAAMVGDLQEASKYIYQRCLLDNKRETALLKAVKAKHREVALLLVDEEAGCIDDQGYSAAYYALMYGLADVFQALLPLERALLTRCGVPHIFLAVSQRENYSFEITPSDVTMVLGTSQVTPLMVAAAAGAREMCMVLAPQLHGRRDTFGNTALYFAIQNASLEATEALVAWEKGLRVSEGRTCLIFALERYYALTEQIAAASKELDMDRIKTLSAEATTLVSIIGILIPFEMGLVDSYGRTALMFACRTGNTYIINQLVDKEAGLQARDGSTALMVAADLCDTHTIPLLIEKEGSLFQPPSERYPNGKKALNWALESKAQISAQQREEAVRMLMWEPMTGSGSEASRTSGRETAAEDFTRFLIIMAPALILLVILLLRYYHRKK